MSYLCKLGYVQDLSASYDHELESISMFELNIELTKKGMDKYEEVMEIVF